MPLHATLDTLRSSKQPRLGCCPDLMESAVFTCDTRYLDGPLCYRLATTFCILVPDFGAGITHSVHRLRYGLGDRRSIPVNGNDGIVSLRHSIHTALRSTKSPIQWVRGLFLQG
jgi:hypothetical protein